MRPAAYLGEPLRPPPSLDAYPIDAAFPQLEIASVPSLMLEIFRAHLTPARGKTCRILECTPFRFRCRQSTARCVLVYTLRVADLATGRQWDQWVTGLIYADEGEAQRRWRNLRQAEAVNDMPSAWRCFEPVSYIPDLEMVVELFPYDRRLPQLSRVLNGATRDLDPLLLERLGPGTWEPGEGIIEPKRYRSELGAVLRYALPARDRECGRSAEASCYLKVYRNGRGRETFEFMRSWSDRGARASREYSLVEPLAYMDDLRTLVLEEAHGTSLHEILAGGGDPVAPARAVARALAAFHRDDLPLARCHTLDDQLDQLRRSSSLIQWACPEVRSEVRGITAAVVAELEEAEPAPFHRDLGADHVFVSDPRVTFVDIDSMALGDPVRDPARLTAHIASTASLGAADDRLRAATTAFVEEYFGDVPRSWRKRFRPHCVGAFVEVAAGIFRSQGTGWRERVHRAAADARRALAGQFG